MLSSDIFTGTGEHYNLNCNNCSHSTHFKVSFKENGDCDDNEDHTLPTVLGCFGKALFQRGAVRIDHIFIWKNTKCCRVSGLKTTSKECCKCIELMGHTCVYEGTSQVECKRGVM